MKAKKEGWRAGVVSEIRWGEWREDYYPTITIWGVVATNDAGRKMVYCGPVPTGNRIECQSLADRINDHAARNPKWSPDLKADFWWEDDPVYGSEEYERQGTELARCFRERADDAWYYEDAVRNSYMA